MSFFARVAPGGAFSSEVRMGKIVRMIDRRDGEDLVWKRVS